MGESARLAVAQGYCKVSQLVGRLAGTDAFRRHWTWPCLARPKQGCLQDLAVYDVGGDDIRSCSGLRPPSHRSSATQQHRSNATMEWVMARPRISFVQKQIP